MPVNTITTMNLTELYDRYTPDKSEILLEFSPAKTESLVIHFFSKHPEVTPEAIKFIVNRYSTLLTINDRAGQPVLSAASGQRDIDAIITKDGGDGWPVVFELVSDNTIPTDLPTSITQIPDEPVLIVDEGGVKVYRADTHNRCKAIRSVIFSVPVFKSVYEALPDAQKNAAGVHPFGWCVTHDTANYGYYRPTRSFYFVIDSNRPVTDRWCISVIQPIQYSNIPSITDMTNSSSVPSNGYTTWDFIYDLYPVLRAHRQQFQFDPVHPAEKSQMEFRNIEYRDLDRSRAAKSDSYLYRWYTANTGKALPISRFLTLGREYQDKYIESRLPKMFVGDPNGLGYSRSSLFFETGGHAYISLNEAFKQLLAAGKSGIVKRIAARYSQQINEHVLELNSEGLPILTPGGEVAVIKEPVIIERLPVSRKYIYGKLTSRGAGELTPMVYTFGDNVGDVRHNAIKRSITAEDLTNPADKAVHDELVKILYTLQLFYQNKTV